MLHSNKQRRTLVRLAHLTLSVPLGITLYAPENVAQPGMLFMQTAGFPALVLSGL